jgi:hypothetical protein
MGLKHEFTFRLSAAQYKILEKLSAKMMLGKADVLRVALARLAEAEKLLDGARK